MKTVFAAILILTLPGAAHAQWGTGANSRSNNVQGYMRNNGTYVNSYQRTNPDANRNNNYGSRGNNNPNTWR